MNDVWLNPALKNTAPKTAIFADRDGTLIRHVDYIDDPAKVELLPGVKDCIHSLINTEIPFFILTNQSGVGRGFFPIERVHACQMRMFELLEIKPTQIAGWCIAPEAPDAENVENSYRKPSARFINEASAYLGIHARDCHMIGDTLVDLETAWHSEARGWAVKCGKSYLPKSRREGKVTGGAYQIRLDLKTCISEILRS